MILWGPATALNLITFVAVVCKKCELLPAICFFFLVTFVITFLFPFFQFLLFYRSDFIFLKILLLWSAHAQSKSPLSKQRFRLYIVVNIDFLFQRFRECKFECKLLFLRLAENLKSVFGWVIGQEGKLLATSSLKKSTCRLAMKLTLDSKVHHSGSHKQSKFSLCTPFLLQVLR